MQRTHTAPYPAFSFCAESRSLRRPPQLGLDSVLCLDLYPDLSSVGPVLASEKEVHPADSRCICVSKEPLTTRVQCHAGQLCLMWPRSFGLMSDLEMEI